MSIAPRRIHSNFPAMVDWSRPHTSHHCSKAERSFGRASPALNQWNSRPAGLLRFAMPQRYEPPGTQAGGPASATCGATGQPLAIGVFTVAFRRRPMRGLHTVLVTELAAVKR